MVSKKMVRLLATLMMVVGIVVAMVPALAQDEQLDGPGWCSGVNLRFFAGGTEGDAFATIVYRGALAAARDTGANVEYVFSGWDSPTMVQQLREAIAAQPDGIAMMGHPGDDAIMPLAADAAEAGIKMMYQNVDVPLVRAAHGGGYVGAQLGPQGRALAEEAIRQFDLTPGATVLVLANVTDANRAQRELGTAEGFEEAGFNVVMVDSPPDWAADPNLGIPAISAALLNNPEAEVIVFSGGQLLGNTPAFLQAAGIEPGGINAIGFDTSELIIQNFREGWVQLTSDQQPWLQGYMPVLSLCQQVKFGLGALNVDTGAGFIDTSNFEQVAELAIAGLR
jgi:simple sugar transport system substrate-binding protein